MNNILYYTVEKQLQDVDGIEETTGLKTVNVYSIVDNKIVKFFDLELLNTENTEKAINGYLEDNGYGDDVWELKIL